MYETSASIVQHTDIPLLHSTALGLHTQSPGKLLFTYHPTMGRWLSWPEHTVG